MMSDLHIKKHNGDSAYFIQMVYKYFDEVISPDELSYIQAKIQDDSNYRKLFFDIIVQDQYVHDIISTDFSTEIKDDLKLEIKEGFAGDLWESLAEVERTAITVEVEKPVAEPVEVTRGITKIEKQLPSKLSIYTAFLSTAAMLLLLLYVWIVPQDPPIVASLGYTVDAVWGQSTEEKVMGEELRTGAYYLEKGLAQIIFYDGAKAILEGPADFELSSTSAMELISGKVVANVNREAAGFTVKTPSGKVLDLGTEFGVDVDLAGDSDIHVFDGEVVLYPKNNGKKVPLLKGKAKRITTSGKQKDIELNNYAFVHQDEFNSNVKAQQGSQYHKWLAYSYQLRRDPGLVAYYTFEKDDDNPDKLKNVAVATADRCDGLLLSENESQLPTWTQGRWPNKTALEFDQSKKQMVEVSNDPALNIAGPLTLSTWINYPDFEEGGGGVIVSKRTRNNINYSMSYGFYDGVSRKRVVAFARYAKYLDPKIKSRKLSLKPDTWYHVVLSHDNRKVRCYIDGRLFDIKPHIFQHSPVESRLLLGAVENYADGLIGRTSTGFFDGIIGEVAIFKRTLSDQEIAEMYEAGRPR